MPLMKIIIIIKIIHERETRKHNNKKQTKTEKSKGRQQGEG